MHVDWHGFFRVGSPAKAERLAARMAEALGREVVVVRAERYWKDAALFDVRLRTPLAARTLAEATVETLVLCQAVAPRWRVAGPVFDADGASGTFDGEASLGAGDHISIAGIELLLFAVRGPSAGQVAGAGGLAGDERPG